MLKECNMTPTTQSKASFPGIIFMFCKWSSRSWDNFLEPSQRFATFYFIEYGSSSQDSFLDSSAQPAGESEFSLSSFCATQSMATRYSSTVSNIGGPSIVTPEVAKPSVCSSRQAHGGPFWVAICMPMNSLIPSAAVAAGYGGFGSSANFPGNFALNPSSSSGATPASYDDILSSQFKDSAHLLSIPQNETPGMWTHAAGSRSVSALPANTYYTLQGQTQESILRQMQQQISERAYFSAMFPDQLICKSVSLAARAF